ncbi:ATPase domain-containing protein [Chloroflexota bacterium]
MLKDIKRMPTGISGFDEITEGGLPEGRTVLLTGSAGSGKTTFGMQFLYNGATKYGESGVFVTLQEELSDLTQDMGRYGWDIEDLSQKGKLRLVQPPVPFELADQDIKIDTMLDVIHKRVMEIDAKRIVFDSLAQLGLPYSDIIALRRDIMRLSSLLRELGCTTILITEMLDGEGKVSRYGVEEFVTQGVIILHSAPSYRAIQVSKLRGTKHDTGLHRVRITDKGISVFPGEAPF